MPNETYREELGGRHPEQTRASGAPHSLLEELYATIEGLRHGNMLLRRLFDANVIGVAIGPFGEAITDANDLALKVIGYSREDLRGHSLPWAELLPSGSLPAVHQAIEQLRAVGFCTPFEVDLVKKDGEIARALIGAAQLEGTGRVASFMIDLTRQRQAEQALRENERRMSAIIAAIPDLIIRIDRTGVVRDCPVAVTNDILIRPEELVGRSLETIFPLEVAREAMRNVVAALETGRLQVFEYHLEHGREQRYFEARIATCGEDEVMAIVRDISERKKAEEAFRASELRFRSLIERSWDAVALVDRQRNVIYASPSVTRILGYPQEEIRRIDPFTTVHPDDRERMLMRFNEIALTPGASMSGQYRQRRRSGEWVWIECTATNLLHEPAIGAVVINFRDITEQKNAEIEARRGREAAESANFAKDMFLAVLSHELRTPLTPVLAAVQLMESEPELSDDLRSCLDIIHRNVDVEVRLIDDLLDLTRIARGKVDLAMGRIDTHETLRRTMEVVAADVAAKDIALVLDLAAPHPEVMADPARLQQVFWNLLKNAIKFSQAGGTVTVSTRNDTHGWVVVEVTDTGIGIDAEHLRRIFNPFDQGEQSITRRFGGLGLGLAISRNLVDLHGGVIAARSEGEGRGATFTVTLPTA